MRVRGHNPFAPVVHDMPDDIPWQDWILSDGVLDISGSLNREKPPRNRNHNNSASAPAQLQFQPLR